MTDTPRGRFWKYLLAIVIFLALALGWEMAGFRNGPQFAMRVALILAIAIGVGQFVRRRFIRKEL